MSILPVPNMSAALVLFKNGKGYITSPWNLWFQQFSQAPPAIDSVTVGASPYTFTASSNGTLYVIGGTVSQIAITRGANSFNTGGTIRNISLAKNDIVTITYSVLPTIQFMPF